MLSLFKYFKDIYYRLCKLFGRPSLATNNKHNMNLQANRTIELNGKKYVKVKLRFVDTLDKNSTKLLLNLEAENESLKKANENLMAENQSLLEKNKALEMLNINLYRDFKHHQLKFETEKEKLRESFLKKELEDIDMIDKYKEIVIANQRALEDKNKKLKSKKIEIQSLWSIVKQKDKENQSLMKLIAKTKDDFLDDDDK